MMIDASGTQLNLLKRLLSPLPCLRREFPVFGRAGMHSDELPVGTTQGFSMLFSHFLKRR